MVRSAHAAGCRSAKELVRTRELTGEGVDAVTLIDATSRQVHAMAAGVAKAHVKTEATLRQVHEVAARAAGAGFAVVAIGLEPVSNALVGARATLGAAARTTTELAAILARVADQETVELLVATLAPVPAALCMVDADLMAARAAIGDARRHVVTVLQGGQPGPLLTALDNINEVLLLVRQRADMAQTHVATAIIGARRLGHPDEPVPAGNDPSNDPRTADVTDHEPGTVGRGDPIPEWVHDAALRLPYRRNGKGPTHGSLADPGGAPLAGPSPPAGGLLRSGAMPGARDGLRTDWHPLAQVTTEHVEAHAAALLRRPGAPRHAVLIINNPTCTSRGQYVGCDELLPGMLPNSTRLTVYLSDGRTATLAATYTGTGEGIAP